MKYDISDVSDTILSYSSSPTVEVYNIQDKISKKKKFLL